MISVEQSNGAIHVTDAAKNELTIRTPDWTPGGTPREIGRGVDESIAGHATELRFPLAAVCVDSAGKDQWETFIGGLDVIELDPDTHVIQIEAPVLTFVHVTGEATIRRRPSGDEVVVTFSEPAFVSLGFRSRIQLPTGTLRVPPTPEGLATALSHASVALKTPSPDRSYPSLRGHPPLIELADEIDIPRDVRTDKPDNGVRLQLPSSLDALFTAAPLAYYLQAAVTSGGVDSPRLTAGSIAHEFSPMPEFQHEVADLLHRTFFLDCLVRNAGPYGTDLAEFALLDRTDIDPSRIYEADATARLESYLAAEFEPIRSELPEWHLSMYVDPTPENIRSIPYFLDRLSLIYLPQATPLARGELVTRSLADGYRSNARSPSGTSVSLLSPDLHRGRVHGWMSDGVPIDVFKAHPDAFANRFDYLERNDGVKSVTVVINDSEMVEEQAKTTQVYQDRASDISLKVDIKKHLTQDGLASVFESSLDFVHYIGHCDSDGLRCTNGNLDFSCIRESNVETFFLNSCGSYRQGRALIRKGSVAGGVTLSEVLNREAVHVGTALAQLLVAGYSMEQGLRLARRHSIMNKRYLVIGDGTHRLSPGEDVYPLFTEIETSDDQFQIAVNTVSYDLGGIYQPYISDGDLTHLQGNKIRFTLSKNELMKYLENIYEPIIYEGEYYWSNELHSMLTEST